MPPLPKRYAPFVYGTIQVAITTAVATAIATQRATDLGLQLLEQWAVAWLLAFVTMLPVIVLLARLIERTASVLPKRYAPFGYGTIQAAVTTGIATAIATYRVTGLELRFLEQWVLAWLMAFVTMLPVVVFVAPLIQRAVSALTTVDPVRRRQPDR